MRISDWSSDVCSSDLDSVDGPMPQTRFVTQKAFNMGLNPIVVLNKIDRVGARPDWVVDQVFELFDRLGANDKQLDFPFIYARSEEHTTELQSLMRISYAVFCLKTKTTTKQ